MEVTIKNGDHQGSFLYVDIQTSNSTRLPRLVPPTGLLGTSTDVSRGRENIPSMNINPRNPGELMPSLTQDLD